MIVRPEGITALALACVLACGTTSATVSGARGRLVDVRGQRIHVVSEGHGPPVVLLHGWPETGYEWRKVMPDLARDHEVFAFDLRGMGESSLAPDGYDKKTLAEDVHAAMAQLHIAKADIVGHDWGASVAYAYAAQFPEAVDHLVVCEGVPFGPWMKKLDIYWYFAFMRIPGVEKMIAGHEREYLTWFYQQAPNHRVQGAIDDTAVSTYVTALMRPGRFSASLELYRTIPQDVTDNAELMKTKLAMPVLAIAGDHGAQDHVVTAMREVATDVSSLIMSDTGHFIPEERPEQFAAALRSFFAGTLARESTWSPPHPTNAPDRGLPVAPLEIAPTPLAASTIALPPGFEQRVVTANGQQLHVVIGGHGDPIVLVHGWPETWYEWHAVMPLLAANHTVIVPDLRGLGDSARANTGFDKKTLAEDLYQLIHGLGFAKVTLVGHDWGAPVAYAYAANHRDAVAKLVVIEGVPNGPWTKDREPFWFFGFHSIPNFAERVLAGHEREYLMWFYKNPELARGAITDTAIEEYARSYASPAGIKAGAELWRALDQDIVDNKDAQEHLLEIPVLAIGAEHGNGALVGKTMKLIAAHVTETIVPGASHFLPEQQPDLIATKILDFVRSSF